MELRWTPEAIRDRESIYDYIEADNSIAALALDELCEEKAGRLVDHPGLGRPGRVAGTRELVAHQNHIIKARPQAGRLLPEFAMAWFNSEAGRDHFFKSGKTTSGLGTINSTVIRTAPIPLPSIETQQAWVAKLSTTHSDAHAKRAEAATLRQSA